MIWVCDMNRFDDCDWIYINKWVDEVFWRVFLDSVFEISFVRYILFFI